MRGYLGVWVSQVYHLRHIVVTSVTFLAIGFEIALITLKNALVVLRTLSFFAGATRRMTVSVQNGSVDTAPLRASTENCTAAQLVMPVPMVSAPVNGALMSAKPLRTAATPLKPDAFRHYLCDHPDQHFVSVVIDMIINGADIGYFGPVCSRFTANAKSAREHDDVLIKAIEKEVLLGHTTGPFIKPPFKYFSISFLGVREKKPSGHRVILDLSRPEGNSVNDYIDGDAYTVSYCSVDDAVRLLTHMGVGAIMCKQDIKHAFRLIPVRPADWPLLGYKVAGNYYHDVVLPFGGRSSPRLFCMISEALHWIVADVSKKFSFLHYVDDFFFVELTVEACTFIVNTLLRIAQDLGIPFSPDKADGPSTRLPFLGIVLDSVAQTLSLPVGKLEEIIALIAVWQKRSVC
ncbi:uncharacterized protein LOC129583444 [Paramacrobiotus metropolitanus]|uniref:uncharacterized protein LOC129583444 n=1 Tax=Paramacrobiotus metropolitanus TaxID=2943436 RepID=UPI0024459AC3|nr:uncharacterized protein LOC129583444 [Paramacrobiotus metropolitanus]